MYNVLADRMQALAGPSTMASYARACAAQRQGIEVIDLSLGAPNLPTPDVACAYAKAAIDTGKYFGYAPVAGYPELQEAIAHKLRQENAIAANSKEILVTSGAKHALSNIFLSILNPLDEVIVCTPAWGTYAAQVRLAGGIVKEVLAEEHTGFVPDIAALTAQITPRTKAIVYASPCNPTGRVFSRAYLEALAHALQKHPHVLVIADEIYEHICFGCEHVSMASLSGMQERTVTVNGFSKGFAMPGWRVGYMHGPEWLVDACTRLQGQMTSAPSSVAMQAALGALQGHTLEESLARAAVYQGQRDALTQALQELLLGHSFVEPQGALYVFLRVEQHWGAAPVEGGYTIQCAQDLCNYILEHAHVAVVPGEVFGDGRYVRICYSQPADVLRKAVRRIRLALDRLHSGSGG